MIDVRIIHTLLDYHYARWQQIWASIMTLSEDQFLQAVPYSHGSLRNQMVHVVKDDAKWIAIAAGEAYASNLQPDDFTSRAAVRAEYDRVEATVLAFVHGLESNMLSTVRIWAPQHVMLWEIFLHMVNHGTDHRAQVLRVLHDFAAPSFDQDLMGYWVTTGRTRPPRE